LFISAAWDGEGNNGYIKKIDRIIRSDKDFMNLLIFFMAYLIINQLKVESYKLIDNFSQTTIEVSNYHSIFITI
jgi:hypothetical protein